MYQIGPYAVGGVAARKAARKPRLHITETAEYQYALAGARLLDARGEGGWRFVICLEVLNITSVTMCALAQIFGDYDYGLFKVGLEPNESLAHGFYATQRTNKRLVLAWSYIVANGIR